MRPILITEETIFVLTRRNYKVDVDLGHPTLRIQQRHTSILDPRTGSSYIRRSALPEAFLRHITSYIDKQEVRDATQNR